MIFRVVYISQEDPVPPSWMSAELLDQLVEPCGRWGKLNSL